MVRVGFEQGDEGLERLPGFAHKKAQKCTEVSQGLPHVVAGIAEDEVLRVSDHSLPCVSGLAFEIPACKCTSDWEVRPCEVAMASGGYQQIVFDPYTSEGSQFVN